MSLTQERLQRSILIRYNEIELEGSSLAAALPKHALLRHGGD